MPRLLKSSIAIAVLSSFLVACGGSVPTAMPGAPGASIATNPVGTDPQAVAPVAGDGAMASSTTPSDTAGNATVQGTAPATANAQATAPGLIRYNLVPDGTQADYRVREQLARLSFPTDAVGKTTSVTGSIGLGADGRVVNDQSKFVVDLTSLQSDSRSRDQYIQRNTLDTARFPNAVFVPTEIRGLNMPLPTSGTQSFQMIGNLTIHGVTKPATFDVVSQVNGNDVTGQATTQFKLEDFGMTSPTAGAVLSVVDNVTLEINLHLVGANQ